MRDALGSGWPGVYGQPSTQALFDRRAMLDLLLVPVGILYLLVVGLLFIYGLNFFYLTWITWRYRQEPAQPQPLQPLPSVTVQLPLYNEKIGRASCRER